MIFDYICTYQLIDDLEESNILYQMQFLQAFDLNNYDNDIINSIQNSLYEKYKDNIEIKEFIKLIKKKIKNDKLKNIIYFNILFSYDYFYIFHNCLRELEKNKKISETNYNILINKIQ